jgi:ankyrin repeat protein
MFSRKAIGLLLTLLLIGLFGVPVWLTYRQARQDRLNHALIAAIQHDDMPAALAALRAGADPNSRDDDSPSLTFWQSLRRLFTGLRKHDSSPTLQPGDTALILALDNETLDEFTPKPVRAPLIQALVAREAEVNVREDDGDEDTCLMLAIIKEPADTVRTILVKGAEVNVRDKEGDTALFYAACNDRPDIVKLFLDRGADVNARNNNGETALSAAKTNGYQDIVRILKQANEKR